MSLLGRDIIVEVVVTTDTQGQTKAAFSVLDPDAPILTVVEGLLKAANRIAQEAEALAAKHKIAIQISPAGDLSITPQ